MLFYAGLAILEFFSGFVSFHLWRLVFCMGFKEIPEYTGYMHGFDALSTMLNVCCMGFNRLLIFGCVLHGFYGFVNILLCVAWVLAFF